ncbi:phosphotransferase [Raoultibacter phocaeensis]|uniref:phosphotransferase n=1 Tax=Raoultibacter phocaeensis TaxID=2479841 RepID=UPI0011193F4C|nr:phosphotransferase [Raoultibacter phocaeensis]
MGDTQAYLKPVDNAIILAAGFGSRFVPLTYDTPKGLLEVHGKPMLERQIEQLIEAGITDIVIVIGYMKEAFEYLVDAYGVKLIYNPDYATKNNLESLRLAAPYLKNSYVLMADNWIERSPFNAHESHSWFSCLRFDGPTDEWCIESDESGRITSIEIGGADALAIVGPAFFDEAFSNRFKELMDEYARCPDADDFYWEQVLKDHIDELVMYVNDQTGNVHEFECLEELRAYDVSYATDSRNEVMRFIADSFGVEESAITDIFPLKEGVTNNSFHFALGSDEYVLRVPGIGTDKQIDRRSEKLVYDSIAPLGISDEVVRFDAETGIKITRYWHDVRSADPFDDRDLEISMQQIKKVHELAIEIPHRFDIARMIADYYALAESAHAIRFRDIEETNRKVRRLFALKKRVEVPEILCHGDYAHINILMLPDGEGRVIDWEFAGMGDPIMDVAMYAIFAELDKERIDLALRLYVGDEPTENEWTRHYLYVALGGFLWCMWAEYKQALGQEFGEYPMTMYRYTKDFYRELEKRGAFEGISDTWDPFGIQSE